MATQTPPLAPANTVLGQIQRQVSDWRVRLAMSFGAGIEGGNLYTGPWGVGDQGHSFGPFQINLPFHPTMNQTTATNPQTAVAYMLSSYQSAVSQVSATLWQTNPEKAAEQATFIAERPAQDYYVARGSGAVDAAYRQAVNGLAGNTGGGIQTIASGGGYGQSGGFGVPVPYPKAPTGALTPDVRAKIVAFVSAVAAKMGLGPPHGGYASWSDARLEQQYTASMKYNAGNLQAPGTPGNNGQIPIASDVVNGAVNAAAAALKGILAPLGKFVVNGAIVIMGVVIIVVALVMLSKSDDDTNPGAPSSFGNGGNSAQRATGGRASDVDEAAIAE